MKSGTDIHSQHKSLIATLCSAMYDFEPHTVRSTLIATLAPDAIVQLCYPFEALSGATQLYDDVYAGLVSAIPDLERRDYIRT